MRHFLSSVSANYLIRAVFVIIISDVLKVFCSKIRKFIRTLSTGCAAQSNEFLLLLVEVYKTCNSWHCTLTRNCSLYTQNTKHIRRTKVNTKLVITELSLNCHFRSHWTFVANNQRLIQLNLSLTFFYSASLLLFLSKSTMRWTI